DAAQLGRRLLSFLSRHPRCRFHRNGALGSARPDGPHRALAVRRSWGRRMTPPAIQTESLCKSFGGLHAVVDVTLSVTPGERRVLIGPNGAGKTTLFHCIAGTHHPTSGRVLL